jgi:hypothetical protein
MATITEQTLERIRQLQGVAQGADVDQLQKIKQAIARTKANRTIAMQIEQLEPGRGEELLGDTGRTAMNALGAVGHFLDTPGRELIRRPIAKGMEYFGAIPEGTSQSKSISSSEIMRAAGMPDNFMTSILGFTGDVVSDPLIYLKAPIALSKLASKFGSIANVPLTKVGAEAIGKRATEYFKAAGNKGYTSAFNKAKGEFEEAARSQIIDPKFIEKGGIKVGIPFTSIERTLIPGSSFKRANSVIRSAMDQNAIGKHILPVFDDIALKASSIFKKAGVYDVDTQVAMQKYDQDLALSQVATKEFMTQTVGPWWDTGWMKAGKNKKNMGAIRDAIENLRSADDKVSTAFDFLPTATRSLKNLSEAKSDVGKITKFFDEMITNPTGDHAMRFKEGLKNSDFVGDDGFRTAAESAKQIQVAFSDKWNQMAEVLGKDAAPKFWAAYMPLVMKLGKNKRAMAGNVNAQTVSGMITGVGKAGRQFETYHDAVDFIHTVAKEQGIENVGRYLEVVDDPAQLISSSLLAADRAIALKKYSNHMVELAQRTVIPGRGKFAGIAFKVKNADQLPNPHEGLVKMTDEMRELHYGGRGGGQTNPALAAAKTPQQSDAIARRLMEEGEKLQTPGSDFIPKTVNVLETIDLPDGQYFGRREIVEGLNSLAPLDGSGKFRSEVAGWFQNLTNNFKRGVTQGFASFHIRNAYSDTIRQLEDDLVGSIKNGGERQVQALLIMGNKKGTFKTAAGAEISFDEIRELFKANLQGFKVGRGDYTQSFLNEMRQSHGSLKHMAAKYMGFMERSGVAVENHGKMLGYLNAIDRGLDPSTDAVSRVFRTHFNYGWITEADKQIKKVIPFWIWQKKAAQHIFTQMIENPGSQSTILRGLQGLETELPRGLGINPLTEAQRSVLPEFLQEGPVIPFWADSEVSGDIGLASGLDITQGELSKLAMFNAPSFSDFKRQMAQFASMMNPAIKIPAELLAGQDFFFGTPIDDLSRTTAEGEKKYQFRQNVTAPFSEKRLNALEDPVSRRFIEFAALLASTIPGLSGTAALGRIISEKRRVEGLYEAAKQRDIGKTIGAGANLLAGVRVRPQNIQNLTIQRTAGGASAKNEQLRQKLYELRRAAAGTQQ